MIAVGVDAGGTQTVALAIRDGALCEPVTGSPANPHAAGMEGAANAIRDAILVATGGSTPDAIVVGAAGAGVREVADAMLAALAARFPGARVDVRDDAHVALRSAVPSGNGMALIAGTGSIAHAEIDGRTHRAGGFGSLLGDEGSGFAIGAAALRAALRAFEGRAPKDELFEAVTARVDAKSARGLVAYVYDTGAPIAAVAGFAPLVIDAASRGDRAASKIVQAAALELFELVSAVVRMASPLPEGELPLALYGGLLGTNSLLTYLVETRVANELPQLAILKQAMPAYAAAAAAAQALLE